MRGADARRCRSHAWHLPRVLSGSATRVCLAGDQKVCWSVPSIDDGNITEGITACQLPSIHEGSERTYEADRLGRSPRLSCMRFGSRRGPVTTRVLALHE